MSYCRWSSLCEDGSTSDIYTYADVRGGYTTHVAERRPIKDGWEKIDLPDGGESFNDETAGEAADRLEKLSKLGYHVPRHAITALRGENEDNL